MAHGSAPLLVIAALALCGCGAYYPSDPNTPTSSGGEQIAPLTCTPIAAPKACPSPEPHYADVQPVFQQRCVICHSGVPTGPWPLDSYEPISDWQDSVRSDLLDCTMPPPDAGPMPDDEKRQILDWLRCGLPQ